MIRTLFALMLGASAAVAEETIFYMPSGDPAMAAAMEEARASLPLFLKNVLDQRGIGPTGAALKVAFQTEDAAHPVEYIWVSPFLFLPDGRMAGLSTNAGQYADVKADQTTTFARDQVVDWSWRPGDGKAWGDYTTRVVFAAQKADAKALMGVDFSDPIVPPDWK